MANSCKYCLSEIPTMIAPCKCNGSIKYVHRDCINRWISIKNKNSCEICGTTYKTQTRTEINWTHVCIDFSLYIIPYFSGVVGIFANILSRDIERLAICQMISSYLPLYSTIQIIVALNTIFGAAILCYISLGILKFKKECVLIPKELPEHYISPATSTSCMLVVNISFVIGTIFWGVILYRGYKSSLLKNTRTIREIA